MRISDWSSDVCSSDLQPGSRATQRQSSWAGVESVRPRQIKTLDPLPRHVRELHADDRDHLVWVVIRTCIIGEAVGGRDDFRLLLGRRRKVDECRVDRKSTRLNSVTNAHLVCRLLLAKKHDYHEQNDYS